MTKTKKRNTILVTLSLLFVFLFNFAVSAMGNDRDLIMNDLPEKMQQLILQHENEGKNIIFVSEQNQTAATRAASASTVNLPGSGYTTDYTFRSASEAFTVGTNFYISSACTMKVFLTTTYQYDPAYFNLKVYCVNTGRYVHNKSHYVSSDAEDPIDVAVTKGYTYTVTITSSAANTHIATYIYGA